LEVSSLWLSLRPPFFNSKNKEKQRKTNKNRFLFVKPPCFCWFFFVFVGFFKDAERSTNHFFSIFQKNNVFGGTIADDHDIFLLSGDRKLLS